MTIMASWFFLFFFVRCVLLKRKLANKLTKCANQMADKQNNNRKKIFISIKKYLRYSAIDSRTKAARNATIIVRAAIFSAESQLG